MAEMSWNGCGGPPPAGPGGRGEVSPPPPQTSLRAAGGFAGLPRAAAPSPCAPGAFAHNILVDSLSFFPDGKTLVSAGRDGLVKFWTVPGGALFRAATTDHVPLQVAVSPNRGQLAVAMDSGQLQLWPADGGARRTLRS